MATFQQFVVLFQASMASGVGRIYYPETLKDQDINAVLATYSQQGFEVIGQKLSDYRGMIVLRKSE
jgi:hypothetical protein